PVRRPHRARRGAAEAEPSRLLAVAHRLPVRDGREREPAAALEPRPVQLEREVERHELTGEVGAKLAGRLDEDARSSLGPDAAAVEHERTQTILGRNEAEGSDR